MVVRPGPCDCGVTVLLTGLPSAGKSTIADLVAERLRDDGYRVEVLDGDAMRKTLSAGLGFSREDRYENVQRIGLMAKVLARNGVIVLVPVVAPYADSRDAVRQRHVKSGTHFLEVHVATPVEVCAQRDVKGLYAKRRAGELKGLTGVDDPYETPGEPDLVIPADRQSAVESASALMGLFIEKRFVA
ncbi:adenylyl-sulfate kinase [Streptomyces regalis]|uniref:Adenylyl-sulfate kinase n=1 Tax=Streptomyces regalis TaxID=68262 RepID=A0A101JSC6_9ACTN|nr:adenylyl-sulfate kinase [Streptomyces regalis]KUL32180.1 adenylylsulfate kinase [Streptomyces regalis]